MMHSRWIGCCLALALTGVPLAQERIDLATPETKPNNGAYRIEALTLVVDDAATSGDEGSVQIRLAGQNGEPLVCMYTRTTTPTGTVVITALNKANLSVAYAGTATTGSLKQRIYHRLVVMGESTEVCGKTLSGTLAGAVP